MMVEYQLGRAAAKKGLEDFFQGDPFDKLEKEKYGKYSRIYAFTTENISGYYPQLDWEGRSVLTVCSSGDHIINAFLWGAEKVTAFDINLFSGLYTELKLVALKYLDFQEFKDFFLRDKACPSRSNFDYGAFCSLKTELSDMAVLFFEKLYAYYKNDGSAVRSSWIFNTLHDDAKRKIAYNPYLQNTRNYKHAQQRIRPCSFIQVPVPRLSQKVQQQFDMILLSNIADSVCKLFPREKNPLTAYKELVLMPLLGRLTDRGQLCAAYIYNIYGPRDYLHPSLAEQRESYSHLDNARYEEKLFKGTINGLTDAIIVLKKNLEETR